MANRVATPNLFAPSPPNWSLALLDQNAQAATGAINDSSLGATNGPLADSGAVNAYSVTCSYGTPSAYNNGMTVFFTPANTNTGASTLTVSPLTSLPIVSASGSALTGGELVAGATVGVVCDGTAFRIFSLPTLAQFGAMRLRSVNAIGNPGFEVDQRNVGNAITAAAGTNNAFVVDRWSYGKVAATGVCSLQQTPFNTLVPGTSFQISKRLLRVTLTTAQGTLGAGEYLAIYQTVEGINWRELIADVHSISLLVQSSVAGLKFAVSLNDNPTVTQSIVYICTIPSANTPTLITLPAIPVWPAGNFAWGSGSVGYRIQICLACGTTYTAPATGTWQSGNYFGASGMSNFLGSPTSSTFDLMAIQHEPGSQCTTLMNKPFSQNLDECLRYYQKSVPYATAVGTATSYGIVPVINPTTAALTTPVTSVIFPKRIAKNAPTAVVYNHATGAANSIRSAGTDYTVSSVTVSETGISQLTLSTGLPANNYGWMNYTADTGW